MTAYEAAERRRGEQRDQAIQTGQAQQAAETWYRRTGHCHGCGQPGNFCLCGKPCGCAALHEVGAGIGADPLDVFADAPVSDDQPELFG